MWRRYWLCGNGIKIDKKIFAEFTMKMVYPWIGRDCIDIIEIGKQFGIEKLLTEGNDWKPQNCWKLGKIIRKKRTGKE